MHFPLHNSCRKCATSISQAATLVHSKFHPPPPTSCGNPTALSSLSLFLDTLCAPLGDEKRKTKTHLKQLGEWKAETGRMEKPRTTTDKSRRRKLKPNGPAIHFHPFSTFLARQGEPTTTLSMATKCRENLTFESSFNGHYKAESAKAAGAAGFSLIASSFLRGTQMRAGNSTRRPEFPSRTISKLLHTWTKSFQHNNKK